MKDGSRRAIVAALFANLGIAVAKFVGFAFTGAASLLAEAIHSVADTGNQGLLVLGGRRSQRPPTEEHPFGFGSERYFWAFIVALVLFSFGSLFAIAEGVDKLVHPQEVESPAWAFAILGIAVVLEGFSFRTALREAQPLRRGRSWLGFIRHSKSPELPVVLLEDSGALVGLVFAIVGVALAAITGNGRFDAIGSIAIGTLLGVIAIVLASEMKSLLIGEAASPRLEQAIRAAMEASPEVDRVIHLRTLHLGPDEVLLAAKLEFRSASVEQLARDIDEVERRVRDAVPIATVIYLEPDCYHSTPPTGPAAHEPQ
jgi:cation diffusion facilitator family transporter